MNPRFMNLRYQVDEPGVNSALRRPTKPGPRRKPPRTTHFRPRLQTPRRRKPPSRKFALFPQKFGPPKPTQPSCPYRLNPRITNPCWIPPYEGHSLAINLIAPTPSRKATFWPPHRRRQNTQPRILARFSLSRDFTRFQPPNDPNRGSPNSRPIPHIPTRPRPSRSVSFRMLEFRLQAVASGRTTVIHRLKPALQHLPPSSPSSRSAPRPDAPDWTSRIIRPA